MAILLEICICSLGLVSDLPCRCPAVSNISTGQDGASGQGWWFTGLGSLFSPLGRVVIPGLYMNSDTTNPTSLMMSLSAACVLVREWRCVYNVGQKACPLLKHLNISRKLFDSNSRVSSWLGPMIYWSATMDKCTAAVSQDRCALSHLSTPAIDHRDNYKAITATAQK